MNIYLCDKKEIECLCRLTLQTVVRLGYTSSEMCAYKSFNTVISSYFCLFPYTIFKKTNGKCLMHLLEICILLAA